MELQTVNRYFMSYYSISSCLGDRHPFLSIDASCALNVLFNFTEVLFKCKCKVDKCAYCSAFVYNSLASLSVDVLKRAVFFLCSHFSTKNNLLFFISLLLFDLT